MASTERMTRRDVFEVVAAGVAIGLPIPLSVDMHDHAEGRISLSVRVLDDDCGGVDRWAESLEAGPAKLDPKPFDASGPAPWLRYGVDSMFGGQMLAPNCEVQVWCSVDLAEADPAMLTAALAERPVPPTREVPGPRVGEPVEVVSAVVAS